MAVRRYWSSSGRPAPVDTERRTGDERGALEVENPVDYVADLTHASQQLSFRQLTGRSRVVKWGLDDSERLSGLLSRHW